MVVNCHKKEEHMIDINPKFVRDEDDKKVGVILTVSKFERIIENLEDLHDYRFVKERANKREATFTLDEVKKDLLKKKK